MNAKATMYTLAACLVVVSATAMAASRSWFEAYTSGARGVALRGSASFGTVGDDGRGAFVVTLGAGSPEGAVLFTRADGRPLTPGSYALDEDPARGVQALVITGPASHPTGAYRDWYRAQEELRSSGEAEASRALADDLWDNLARFEFPSPVARARCNSSQ